MTGQQFGPFEFDEDTDRIIQTPSGSPIQDEEGVPIPGSQVGSCRMRLYDVTSGTLIREEDSILNENGGTWTPSGEWAIEITAEDNVILDDMRAWESHVLLVEYEYNSGRKGKMEAVINVRNLVRVP